MYRARRQPLLAASFARRSAVQCPAAGRTYSSEEFSTSSSMRPAGRGTRNPCHQSLGRSQWQISRQLPLQRRGLFDVLPTATPAGKKESSSQHQQQSRSMAHRVWDKEAVTDLFTQYAQEYNGVASLNCDNIRSLLQGIGEIPADNTVSKLFAVADADGNGLIDLDEFLEHAHLFFGDNPARIILVVGGPGSGKGLLSKRLTQECHVVHLSSGDLLRQEVALDTALGRTVRDIMGRGELVSSAVIVALMKKRMKDHPGKRVLLDGFPRSVENAHDLVTLCGTPELALHLNCDDTILMERIMGRGASSDSTPQQVRREDDNFQSALRRLRTFHMYHHTTMDWLRQQHVPIINLDCSGSHESVWQQLLAIGRLMRPAVKLPIPIAYLKDEADLPGAASGSR